MPAWRRLGRSLALPADPPKNHTLVTHPLHILFLTDNFPPEYNAPANRTFEHCREWVRAGHRVTIITCAPNFPTGRPFPGYRNRLWQRETMAGIHVVRVWTYMAPNAGFARRVFDYLSFLPGAVIASWFIRRVDVVVGTSPQFFTVCAAWLAATFKRVPWIFEVRDLWPESIRAVGAMGGGVGRGIEGRGVEGDSRAIRALARLARFLYRRAHRVVVLTHAFKENLVGQGVASAKIDVVTNGVDLSRFQPRPKEAALVEELGLRGCFVAGYIGTHGMAHGLSTLLDAAALLDKDPGAGDIRLLFLGDGARKAKLMAETQVRGLDNVLFLAPVERAEIPRYWSLLDVAVIHLRRSDLFETVIPSKLFECMAMGIPVVHGVRGESADIVRGERIGQLFEPEHAPGLAAALVRMRDNRAGARRIGDGIDYGELRENCLAAAKRYDRKRLALQMLEGIEQVVNIRE
uniref:Glycosyltransferase subfamily 4-like N-terminal domain-containing protein n=1 Tax=Candidatus Kentrum sp. FM TaxID=2126340 RepID=A0A450U021_9GAMM|nr:MAG: hypothetical protein BECKFM1743A_GA0114220_108592 [Candidatus Kentron sp. FM]